MNIESPAVTSPVEPRRSLGLAIKAQRQALGLSQQALAERVVAHGDRTFRQSDVSRLECERVHLPERSRLEHVAAALELPLATLLDRAGWTTLSTNDRHIVTTRATAARLPSPTTPATPRPAPPGLAALAVQPVASDNPLDFSRLHSLIAAAQETRARTQELLARSAALLEWCNQSGSRRVTLAPYRDSPRAGTIGSTSVAERAATEPWDIFIAPAAVAASPAAPSARPQPVAPPAAPREAPPAPEPLVITPTLVERAMWLAVAGSAQLTPAQNADTLCRLAADLGYIVEYAAGPPPGRRPRRSSATAWIHYGDGLTHERIVGDTIATAICLVVGKRLHQPRRSPGRGPVPNRGWRGPAIATGPNRA